MEGETQNGHPPDAGSFFSFLLSLDGPSNRELAEDWIGDRDGLLVFSGLYSATVMVFIVGGNNKMLCTPIAANAHLIAQMSYDLINMLSENGTYNDIQLATSQSPTLYRPSVSILINVIWSTSLALSLFCTIFGIYLRRWAIRYLLHHTPHMDPRIPRHRRLQPIDRLDKFRPSALVALMRLFLALSIFLFYFGFVLFLIQIGVSPVLVFLSSLMIAGLFFFRT
ncbi:hypothetical protein BJV74DRAFT_516337 [Russula compacta]|nr:hypothetical protein BJV74DRAFT_516337 [Russula compacta]